MVSNPAFGTEAIVALALRYPTEDAMDVLETSVDAMNKGSAEREMRRFMKDVNGMPLGELEELYTMTFDLSPVVVPYVGHLAYGDSYERGTFMADLRGAMRSADVDPGTELPDHLDPILRYLGATDEPIDSLEPILVPAITKMQKSLKKSNSKNPYLHVLTAARIVAEESMR
jgi:nitrate reductase delta subunit